MSYPIANSIPQQINFNLNNNSNAVNLIFTQDHSNRFYDTSIGLKSKINDQKDLTVIVETKSIDGFNLNKNLIFKFSKRNDNLDFDISYMYHKEEILTYIIDDNFKRKSEFYASGFKLDFNNSKIQILNKFNFQFSNYSIVQNQSFDDNTIWNELDLNYLIDDNFTFSMASKYKLNIINADSYHYNKNYYSLIYLGSKYKNSNHSLNFGLVDIILADFTKEKHVRPYIFYDISYSKFNFYIKYFTKVYTKIEDDFRYLSNSYKNSNIGFSYNDNIIIQNLTFGLIDDKSIKFNYLSYKGNIDFKWFKSEYELKFFNDDIIFVNSSFNFTVGFYPPIKNKKFDIYLKLHGNHLNLNRNFEIDFSTLPLLLETNISGNYNLNVFDGEIGIIFENFEISFIRENLLNDMYNYSSTLHYPNTSNYLININWTFYE